MFGVQEIADWIGARLVNADVLAAGWREEIRVDSPAALGREAGKTSIAFFFSKHYEEDLLRSVPGILVTGEAFVQALEAHAAVLPFWRKTAVLACEDPYLAMATLSEKFACSLSSVSHIEWPTKTTVHPTAVIHPTVEIDDRVEIGPHVVVEANAKIGAGTVIYSGCTIGPLVHIGKGCVLFPRVTLYERTVLGDRVRLHAGVVIGADGFGYAPVKERVGSGVQAGTHSSVGAHSGVATAPRVTGHRKIFHLGKVVIGHDVEIGANSCVDRGTFGDTVIGDEVKIDNQVQIGHNVRLGRGTIVCGCSGFAGSSSSGEFVYVGGLSGISNQIHVGDRALIGAGTLVTKDVSADGNAVGNPQRDARSHFRVHAWLNRKSREKGKKNGGE